TLLQVLEDGRLTDGHGRTVDFRNTVIIMTSNLGTGFVSQEALGFRAGPQTVTEEDRRKASIEEALKREFRPEFLNRIDDIIVFDPLGEAELGQIVTLLVGEVDRRIGALGVSIEVTPDACAWLASEGSDPVFGARPLRRAVQRYIENPLSKRILSGEFGEGDIVRIGLGDEGLTFEKAEASEGEAGAEPGEAEESEKAAAGV
ncbi:MAG: AAA family ATPase, partial [Dehalococcoidia bacterium]